MHSAKIVAKISTWYQTDFVAPCTKIGSEIHYENRSDWDRALYFKIQNRIKNPVYCTRERYLGRGGGALDGGLFRGFDRQKKKKRCSLRLKVCSLASSVRNVDWRAPQLPTISVTNSLGIAYTPEYMVSAAPIN